jgi:uncharacterized membrane protein
MWTCGLAYVTVSEVRGRNISGRELSILSALVWLVPLVTTTILIADPSGLRNGAYVETCMMPMPGLFGGPAVFALCFNTTAFVFVLFSLYRFSAGATNAEDRRVRRHLGLRFSSYLAAWALCWVGVFVSFFIITDGQCPSMFVYVLTAAFFPLQGFLNFLIFVADGDTVRSVTRRLQTLCNCASGSRFGQTDVVARPSEIDRLMERAQAEYDITG